MPNYCEYTMKVTGLKKNIEEFIKIITADYDYTNNKFSFDRHFWRVFEACVSDIPLDLDENQPTDCFIDGYCAWSVSTCFFQEGYQNTFGKKETNKGTDIETESKLLDLTIEIKSLEMGCAFTEHYLIENGKLLIDESYDFDYSKFFDDDDNFRDELDDEYIKLLTID
ncbi:hypothetical protein [Carnobacterium maltaromaticum]|uniref:hypothetical protein n=1 Tax=Carnobacterium maltaromaticum TaxID=2751 RepID=UPI0012F97741|nr:hypothetical protein [Carnobacterium maltaromaticum]